jgi:uroporphyrin-III C-methyltransferase
VICDGTTERQQVLVSTLGQVAEDAAASGVRPPAVVVVGEVVRLREALGRDVPTRDVPTQDVPTRDVPMQDVPAWEMPGRGAPARDTRGAA